jgi:SAM-dependent methyltransferase
MAGLRSMKLTGERVVTAEGRFNPTWQRHVAAYALASEILPPGRLLDLGCGVGHSYHLLAPRETVGLDISADALAGQERETVEADMREIPFPDGEFASVLSNQSVEHVPDPERVVAEVHRVLQPGGVALFVTPNRLTLGRPDEIIDPYHFRELDHQELADLCAPYFDHVEVFGIFGSPRYMELVEEERAKLERLLRKDPLRLRRVVPVRVKQWLYDAMLSRQRKHPDPRAAVIEVGDFERRDEGLLDALDVCAVCYKAPA